MKTLILVRHAHAASNEHEVVSCAPPGEGLTERGRAQARALHDALAGERIDLGVASELVRTQETLALALGERSVTRLVLPALNDIDFGAFDGGPLATYRQWAWTHPADAACPGGGESRADAAARVAGALELLLDRTDEVVLAVGHALPIRYVLDAAAGRAPEARIAPVANAEPHVLSAAQVTTAMTALRRWSISPRFGEAQS